MRAGEIDLLDLPLPLILRPSSRVSDDDLIRFSVRNNLYKVERNTEGDLVVMTPVGGIGGTHELYVSASLAAWVEQDGTGIAFSPNTGFNLADGSCRAPDAAWVPFHRWDALTEQQRESFLPFCPDFLIEVRSHSDSRKYLEAKMQKWIDNGAQLAWLVDPIDANVLVYRPNQPTETLERPDVVIAHAPVRGFELRTTRLWPKP